jgi:DNA replication protein DnaC
MIETCRNLAHELRLHGILQNVERRVGQAVADNLHPEELLRLLLDDEKLFRKNRTAKMLQTRAHFRFAVALEDWDLSENRGLSKAKWKDIGNLNFLHNRQNLIINGKTGVGKSHLASGLGQKMCQEGLKTKFLSVNFFFEEAIAQKATGKYHGWIRGLGKHQALILDDFGLRSLNHSEATVLVDLLEECHKRCIVIVTSQVEPKGWLNLFEDPVVGEAVVDRLINPSQHLVLLGESYRARLKKSD